jgi:hypothetical protein
MALDAMHAPFSGDKGRRSYILGCFFLPARLTDGTSEPECRMPARLTEEQALLCFHVYGGWFGPPPVLFRAELFDGRIRWRVGLGMGLRLPEPIDLANAELALRWLVVAQHYDRACDLAMSEGMVVDDLLPLRLCLPPFAVAPLLPAHKRRNKQRKKKAESRSVQLSQVLRLAERARQSHCVLDPEEVLSVVSTWPRMVPHR